MRLITIYFQRFHTWKTAHRSPRFIVGAQAVLGSAATCRRGMECTNTAAVNKKLASCRRQECGRLCGWSGSALVNSERGSCSQKLHPPLLSLTYRTRVRADVRRTRETSQGSLVRRCRKITKNSIVLPENSPPQEQWKVPGSKAHKDVFCLLHHENKVFHDISAGRLQHRRRMYKAAQWKSI